MTATHFFRRCYLSILVLIFGLLAHADSPKPSFPPVDSESLGAVSAGALVLHDNWQMREEAIVGDHGDTFSSSSFNATGWYPATVPTTALATLVRNGIYPDPIIGTNMMKIPDVNEAENTRYNLMQFSHLPDHSNPFNRPYWFRTSFTLPASYQGQVVWLHLDGINYRADVWLNGQQIATANDVVGMFKRFRFDISHYGKTGAANTLAIRIHQLDVPGDPVLEQLGGVFGHLGPNCGDRQILANVTMYQSVGWDWTPSVRDRNMGIWQHVWLEATGPVAVRDPAGFVDLKRTPGQDAPIKVRGYLDNPSQQPVNTDIKVRIEPEGFDGPAVEFKQNLSAAPGRNEFILLPTDHPELILHSLLLWEGSNEVPAQSNWVQPMQDTVLPAMDGTRPWTVTSNEAPRNPGGITMHSGGPYLQVPLRKLFYLYAQDPNFVCKNEIGMAAPMCINSIVQSIPDWDQTDDKNFPLNTTFGFHDAIDGYYDATHRAIAQQLGPMPDLMEYVWMGDLYDGEFYRGVYEAANKARPRNEGTHLWKVNASWPSMVWELFDWYLHANSGYYQMKEALQPIHVQYSIDDSGIQVVSTQPNALKGAHVHAEIVSLQGAPESTADFTVDAAADATTVAGSLADKLADCHAHFLALTLTTADGKVLDHDVRWVADDDVVWEMLALAPATVVGTVTDTHVDGTETVDTIGIENSSDVPACDVRSEILCGPQGGEVLPSFWTDNALTLMPHEKREVTVRYRTVLMGGAEPHLMVEGFNVMPREIIVANGKQVPLSIKLIACESAALRNGNPTVKLTYVNAGTSGLRYTSWPIPVAVDGQVVRYAHVDCSGSKETSQTVSFGGLVPGEHAVKAGFPDLATTQGSVQIRVAPFPPGLLSAAPVKAVASSESLQGEVAHLFDGNLTPDSIGKASDLGSVYMAAPRITLRSFGLTTANPSRGTRWFSRNHLPRHPTQTM